MSELTGREVEVLRLKDEEKLSWAKIGERLGTTKSSVNSSYRAAKLKLDRVANPEAYRQAPKADKQAPKANSRSHEARRDGGIARYGTRTLCFHRGRCGDLWFPAIHREEFDAAHGGAVQTPAGRDKAGQG